MHPTRLRTLAIITLTIFTAPASAAWQRVDATPALVAELFADVPLDQRPAPGCSAAPRVLLDDSGNPAGVVPHEGGFAFFVDVPDGIVTDDGLLLYLGGGGACWDGATCLGSALTPASTYYPVFGENVAHLEAAANDAWGDGAGGILTRVDSTNPYADFTKVLVPYCTGDVHVGSNDQAYHYPLPNGAPLSWTIRHRGADNLQVVLKWLQRERDARGWRFARTTIAGSSAGGYGAAINAPAIIEMLGNDADYSLVIDSSNGVLTNGFVDRAFGTTTADGVWGARAYLSDIVSPALELDAGQLWPAVIDALGDAYPRMRISQSTAAYDAVQTLVRMIMKAVDNGSYDPYAMPPGETEIALNALLDWSPKARAGMIATVFRVPNYRYYLGAGEGHVHLIDPPLTPFPTTNYFDENSARGIYYTDWLDDMLNNPRRFFRTDWRNLSCFPNCLPQ